MSVVETNLDHFNGLLSAIASAISEKGTCTMCTTVCRAHAFKSTITSITGEHGSNEPHMAHAPVPWDKTTTAAHVNAGEEQEFSSGTHESAGGLKSLQGAARKTRPALVHSTGFAWTSQRACQAPDLRPAARHCNITNPETPTSQIVWSVATVGEQVRRSMPTNKIPKLVVVRSVRCVAT